MHQSVDVFLIGALILETTSIVIATLEYVDWCISFIIFIIVKHSKEAALALLFILFLTAEGAFPELNARSEHSFFKVTPVGIFVELLSYQIILLTNLN